MKKEYLLIILLITCLTGCTFNTATSRAKNSSKKSTQYVTVTAPEEIRQKAFEWAEKYVEADTHYVLGGQDGLRSIDIDCSGLVVMCYTYAIENTKYSLLFDDSTASDMCYKYTTKVENTVENIKKLQKGDLIFMCPSKYDSPDGTYDPNKIYHVAIFDYYDEEKKNIHFIDATDRKAAEDDWWDNDVDGVTKRYYPYDAYRIHSFGIMNLKYKK